MKAAALNTVFPTCGKAVADCFQSMKETFSLTHEEEASIARKCAETQDKVVEACLRPLSQGNLTPEEEEALWDRVAKGFRQAGGCPRAPGRLGPGLAQRDHLHRRSCRCWRHRNRQSGVGEVLCRFCRKGLPDPSAQAPCRLVLVVPGNPDRSSHERIP